MIFIIKLVFVIYGFLSYRSKNSTKARVGVSDDLDKNDDLMMPNRVTMM